MWKLGDSVPVKLEFSILNSLIKKIRKKQIHFKVQFYSFSTRSRPQIAHKPCICTGCEQSAIEPKIRKQGPNGPISTTAQHNTETSLFHNFCYILFLKSSTNSDDNSDKFKSLLAPNSFNPSSTN